MHCTPGSDKGKTTSEARAKDGKKVTLVVAAANILLSFIKILAGWMGSSHALIADGVHSLSDLATDAVVLFATKKGAQDADDEHPYGHARIETMATVVLATFLLLVSFGIGYDAIRRLFDPAHLPQPGLLALVAAVISVLIKEWLYHYTMVIAKKHRSNLLQANAWHHRSDSISSIIVVVGVVGSMAGLVYLDAIASVIVAFMIAKIGWNLGYTSVNELVDRGLEQEEIAVIRAKIMEVDGVKSMHDLRTRLMGGYAFVDVDVLVDPRLSVSEGHRIGAEVLKRLNNEIDEVVDVTVHIDPEDDRRGTASSNAPMRREMLKILYQCWEPIEGVEKISYVALHYFAGKVRVEAHAALNDFDTIGEANSFAHMISTTAMADKSIAKVQVLFK